MARPAPMLEGPAQEVLEQPQERPAVRYTRQDYGYVNQDLRRILLLACVIVLTIVVLSFFLP